MKLYEVSYLKNNEKKYLTKEFDNKEKAGEFIQKNKDKITAIYYCKENILEVIKPI